MRELRGARAPDAALTRFCSRSPAAKQILQSKSRRSTAGKREGAHTFACAADLSGAFVGALAAWSAGKLMFTASLQRRRYDAYREFPKRSEGRRYCGHTQGY